ncbi:MAG: glycoside hydrolase family 3 N-terminal domain-containing protein [Prolixibacteraceae bacterium]|nr:glycoside hydrolase family 3 N-terminal domain-containing protein [Prolixibacteraceae bacterium]
MNRQMELMTTDQKIAQLMMLAVYPEQEGSGESKTEQLIKKYQPGGIIVMNGSPVQTVKYLNKLQENVAVPLLVAVDGEWGLSMRIDSIASYPYAQALGAIDDSTFIYRMGRDIGLQMKQMGIHVNFAPVADVNTNPSNPVINFRSFGEDKVNVSQKAGYLAAGMQSAGVIPVAKHFPGHGDTDTDSHKLLPVVNHPKTRLDVVESFPFRYLSRGGISGIMSGHLNVPALDKTGVPSSLSGEIINGYLRKEIGFAGLVFTDALNMKGVQSGSNNIETEALKAGNDMIVFVPDIAKAIASVKESLAGNLISLSEIESKCRRLLAAKRWTGLHLYQPADINSLTGRLNAPEFEVTIRKLIQGSLTVLTNNEFLPLKELDNKKIASVMTGASGISPFQKMIERYAAVDHFVLDKTAKESDLFNLRRRLDNYDLVILGIQGIWLYPANYYGTTVIQRNAVADIIRENKCISVFFGNAYALKHFENIHHSGGLILAYQNNPLTQELAAQMVFGAYDATGRLPVTVDDRFKMNDGIFVRSSETLSYSIPEEKGINAELLSRKIDSIARAGIEAYAFPGCQVLVAKDGYVVFHKCYGHPTYQKKTAVQRDDIYDFASLTKVSAPLPAIMRLVDEKKIELDAPLSRYWEPFRGTDKEKIRVREVLAHQAGLPAWIPFWRMCLDDKGKLSNDIFSSEPNGNFNVRVSSGLYLRDDFRQVIYDTIRHVKLLPVRRYVYSDLGFHLFPEIIAKITGESYQDYLKRIFYKPLGAGTLTYNPYLHFPLSRIIPTETDDFFRNEKLRGFVHDEGAAMLGGVSGNAGLFGSTADLAKLFQMYLQKGFFGGKRYISEPTVNEFIRIQFPNNRNRRGLGFDKPFINNNENSLTNAYPAYSAGKNSFGHTGYTGTMAWADPDNGVLFIFMSNRVYPSRENNLLSSLNIRTSMHQAVYDCLGSAVAKY